MPFRLFARLAIQRFPQGVTVAGTVVNGQTTPVTLTLVNTIAGTLSGTVYLPDGVTPVSAGVKVSADGSLPTVTVTLASGLRLSISFTVIVTAPIFGASRLSLISIGVSDPATIAPADSNGR